MPPKKASSGLGAAL
jgi:hypothetical protein